MEITQVAKRLLEINKETKKLKQKTKELEDEKKELEGTFIDLCIENEQDGLIVEGFALRLKEDYIASISNSGAERLKNDPEWGYLVKETVNARTLKSAINEFMVNNSYEISEFKENMPEALKEICYFEEKTKISITKG
jgi:hypothetical protein